LILLRVHYLENGALYYIYSSPYYTKFVEGGGIDSGCPLLGHCPHFKKGDTKEHEGHAHDRSKCPHFNKEAGEKEAGVCPGKTGGVCPMSGGECTCTEEKSCGCKGKDESVCPMSGKTATEGASCPHAAKHAKEQEGIVEDPVVEDDVPNHDEL
jgi:hypothetical protein